MAGAMTSLLRGPSLICPHKPLGSGSGDRCTQRKSSHCSAYRCILAGTSLSLSAFCVRTVSHTPETPVKHRRLRGHVDAYRCCVKSLIGSALVGFDVRQHARAESISKRAQSTTLTSLRLESMICEQSETVYRKTLLQIVLFRDQTGIQQFTGSLEWRFLKTV